jgi:hypothetical protein
MVFALLYYDCDLQPSLPQPALLRVLVDFAAEHIEKKNYFSTATTRAKHGGKCSIRLTMFIHWPFTKTEPSTVLSMLHVKSKPSNNQSPA